MNDNRVTLNTRVSGAGVPFVWAHGLMGSMALEDEAGWFQWDRLIDVAKVVRYDARGHGLSRASYAPEDYVWANLAQDMLTIADSFEIDRFVAGGQSMGCATALYAALSASERILALVLVHPPTAWETRAAQAAIYDQLATLVETQGVGALVGLMQQQPLLPAWLLEAQPEIGEHYLESVRGMDGRMLPELLRGARLCDLPPREQLTTIQVPALILAWVDDATHPLATAEELDRLLPKSRLVVARNLDDVGLWPEMIKEFITGV